MTAVKIEPTKLLKKTILQGKIISVVNMSINIIKKRTNTVKYHIEKVLGKLFEIFTSCLLKKLPFLKLTLFIRERTKKITKGAILPIGHSLNIQLTNILQTLKATVAILNKLSRDILKVFMVISSTFSILSIVLRNRSICKRVILGILIILNSSNSYAVSKDSLKPLVISYEKKYNIPRMLLWSIASVESKGNPLALNISGKSYIAKTVKEALEIIESSVSDGITNIDIGLMQVNLKYHGENFSNIREMLDINNNLNYAAQLLCKLYKTHGGWREAVQHYHSKNPQYHLKYARKVLVAWLEG